MTYGESAPSPFLPADAQMPRIHRSGASPKPRSSPRFRKDGREWVECSRRFGRSNGSRRLPPEAWPCTGISPPVRQPAPGEDPRHVEFRGRSLHIVAAPTSLRSSSALSASELPSSSSFARSSRRFSSRASILGQTRLKNSSRNGMRRRAPRERFIASQMPKNPSLVAVEIFLFPGLGQSQRIGNVLDQIVSGSFLSFFAFSAAVRADSMRIDFGAVAHSSG